MRIGIVTLSLRVNYGNILQAYALQTILQRLGHDVKVISKDYRIPITKQIIFHDIPQRIIKRILGRPCCVFKELKYNRLYQKATVNIKQFITNNIQIDNRYLKQVRETDYDIIVVGSDQIWRPEYIIGGAIQDIYDAFLAFTYSWRIKRVSYAASFGKSQWDYSESITDRIRLLLSQFDYISVREQSGVDICREKFGVSAQYVLDPTMLLDANEYKTLINHTKKSEGDLFAYILDNSPEKAELINTISTEKSMSSYSIIPRFDEINAPLEERIQPPVEQWLRCFYDAQFIITDSFHGCVFSIIFNKPFIAIANKDRGLSRFESLLNSFNLLDHLIFDITQYDKNKSYSIPQKSFELLNQKRKESISFLDKALS